MFFGQSPNESHFHTKGKKVIFGILGFLKFCILQPCSRWIPLIFSQMLEKALKIKYKYKTTQQ